MKLLNNIGLPDEIGFEIVNNFQSFFDDKKDYINFNKKIKEKHIEIYNKYGIKDIIFIRDGDLCVKSYSGNKKIVTEELCIINNIYSFFNSDINKNRDTIYFNQDNKKEREYIEKEIYILHNFLIKKIYELEKVKTPEELCKVSLKLYEYYLASLKSLNGTLLSNEKLISFKFNEELNRYIESVKKLDKNLSQIIDDFVNLPNDDELYININIDKFKLYLSFQLSVLYSDLGQNDKILGTILMYNAIEILNTIEDKTVFFDMLKVIRINNNNIVYGTYNNVDYEMHKKEIQRYLNLPNTSNIINSLKILENKDEITSIDDQYYDKISNTIINAINISQNIGFKDIDLKELNNNIKNKLKDEVTPIKQNKLKSYINRIEFYLNNTKPYKVQEGYGLFKNFHILYYTNGIVAIDRLNGEYGYLYIMPINTYINILKECNIKNLIEIRNIITVKAISHMNLNWQNMASNEINNHLITPDEFSILQSINSITLPINDEKLQEVRIIYANNQFILNKIDEKIKEREQKLDEIDDELRKKDFSNYDVNKEAVDSIAVQEAELELLNNLSNSDDIASNYDYDQTIKTIRSAKVSLETKKRTVEQHGGYVCEMCGEVVSFDTRNFESHHIIPLSMGGIDNVYNTVCLCGTCHDNIHSNIPFTYELLWKMLLNVRKNISKTTPHYIKKFDELFNPYFNYIYNNNLTDDELLEQYKKEEEYYLKHKKQEDKKFLMEWNSLRKK